MAELRASQRLLLALIVLVSASLTLPQLGLRSLWWDEAWSWWFTTVEAKDLWRTAWDQSEVNMISYYALLNVWSRWCDNEFWLRLPSAMFAAGAVWATARLGTILFEPRVGLIAALLMALNSFLLRYGQEARAYSMLLFLTTWSNYFLISALKQDKWKQWCGFVVVSSLCGYAHVFGVLQVFSQVLIVGLLIFLASGRVSKQLLVATGFVLVGTLPVVWFVLAKRGGLDWIPDPTLGSLVAIIKSLAGGGIVLVALAPLVVFGLVRRYRDRVCVAGVGSFSPAAYVVLCFLIPIAFIFAVSFIRPLTVPRFLIATVASLVLAAAVGITAIPQRPLRMAILVTVVFLTLRACIYQLTRDSADDFRSATAYVLEAFEPGDGLIFCLPATKLGFDYYARNARLLPQTIYPPYARPYNDEVLRGKLASADEIATLAAGYHRVFVVCRDDRQERFGPPLLAALEKTSRVIEMREFPEIRVAQLERRE